MDERKKKNETIITIMTVDVDAVNERLNGLVNLLHVVGIDGVDPDTLVEEQKRLSKSGDGGQSSSNRGGGGGTAAQSSDAQILEIIKKLQSAQADSPEILAALKSPELRALASLAAQKQAPAKQPEPPKKAAPSLDDVMDDDDNYPKIGPGYSDDISVVSDLTTPTVMTKQSIAEEEMYKDVNGGPGALPPMHIGVAPNQPSRPGGVGGMPGGAAYAPKTKNLVNRVQPGATRRAIAKSGGAAAQRRLNYQQAMAKLQSSEYGTQASGKQDKNYMEHFSPKKPPTKFFPTTSPTPDPSEFPSIAEQGKKTRSTRNKAAVSSSSSKKKRGTALAAQQEELEEEDAFEDEKPTPQRKTSTNPGGSSSSSSKKKANGSAGSTSSKDKEKKSGGSDLAWGGTDSGWPAFSDPAGGKGASTFVDNDGFFPGDAFGGGDPFAATSSSSKPSSSGRTPDQKIKKSSRDADGKPRKTKSSSKKSGKSSSRARANLAM